MRTRRDLLIGVGATFCLAGCSGNGDTESTTTQQPTTTSTPTPTTTPTQTSTPTETETQTPTETEEPTPEPGTAALNNIEQLLLEDLSNFAMGGGIDDRDLNEPVLSPGTNDNLYEIRDKLGNIDTSELSDELRTRHSRLQSVYWFVWWTKMVHNDAGEIIDAAAESWDKYRDTTTTADPINPLADSLPVASEHFDNLKEDSSKDDLAELEGYTEEDYESVVNRYDQVISQGDTLIEKIRLHKEANSLMENEEYQEDPILENPSSAFIPAPESPRTKGFKHGFFEILAIILLIACIFLVRYEAKH